MEGWGVSSEKDDAMKYEHDEITCKYDLSAFRDIILTISAVLWATFLFSSHISARLALIYDNAKGQSDTELVNFTTDLH
jgi:hypothetical protein